MTVSVRERALPDAVEAGIAGFSVASARRARSVLRTLSEGFPGDAGQGGVWCASGLTGDGFPLELAFTTADGALRWTFDPGVVARGPKRRLETTMAGLRHLGWTMDPDLMDCALRLQEGRTEGFGGYVGGRHDNAGDRFKLYVEMPDGPVAEVAVSLLGLPRPRLPGAPARTRMLGLGPGAGCAEVYFRAEAPTQSLPRLLEPAGEPDAAQRMIALIEEAWGHRLRDRLPGGSVGVSYARAGQGTPTIVTLFLFARALWGGDARIRARMLERLAAHGVSTVPYEVATRPLSIAHTAQTRHGMIGITLSPGRVDWSTGLRPVTMPC